MAVLIENLQDKLEITEKMYALINNAVEFSLKREAFDIPSEISVLLVDNEYIRELNKEHRDVDKPTDVLSFPMVDMMEGKIQSTEGDYDMDENLLLLGDIVVSAEMTQEQAESFGHSFERELAFLVTHGVFHLLGYDHEDEEAAKRMFDRQEAVLVQMGLTREL